MRGDEVDAGVGLAAIALVEIAGACEALRQFRDQTAMAFPEAPNAVAVLAVPLAPEDREVPDLVTALAHIPRLGNQFYLRQNWILVNDVEEGAEAVDGMEFACK